VSDINAVEVDSQSERRCLTPNGRLEKRTWAAYAIPMRTCRTITSRRSRVISRSVLARSIFPRAITGLQAIPGQSSETIWLPIIRRPHNLSSVKNWVAVMPTILPVEAGSLQCPNLALQRPTSPYPAAVVSRASRVRGGHAGQDGGVEG
jgi:hypothetical protein